MAKFMQQLHKSMFNELKRLGRERNISVQELLRSIVIPEYVQAEKQKALMRQQAQNGVSDSMPRVDP